MRHKQHLHHPKLTNLLKLKQKPDAFVTAGDRITNGLLSTLKKLQLKIPDDVAVVGFSNTNIPELINPTLTTIRLPAFEMGQVATELLQSCYRVVTELLIQIIESKRPVTEFETRVLQNEFTISDSSGLKPELQK